MLNWQIIMLIMKTQQQKQILSSLYFAEPEQILLEIIHWINI